MSVETLFPNHNRKPQYYYGINAKYDVKATPAERRARGNAWCAFARANPQIRTRGHATEEAARAEFNKLPAEMQAIADVSLYSPL